MPGLKAARDTSTRPTTGVPASATKLKYQYRGLQIPAIKIIVTGTGRVAKGAVEFLREIKVKEITQQEFLNNAYTEAAFCVLDSDDLYDRISDNGFDRMEFHQHPELYKCVFKDYAYACDLLINCIYWNPKAPQLFIKNDMDDPKWKVKVIADVSCDINGGIPATIRSTTINEPGVPAYAQATQQES